MWLVSYLFLQEGRPVYPLQGHRSCVEKGKANWDQLLASMERRLLIGSLAGRKEESGFYLHAKDVQMSLDGTRGCINYNPALALRQLGYPMRGAPLEGSITHFIAWGFSDPNVRVLRGVCKAWDAGQRGSNYN